jgi:hypothetical protein
LFLLHAATKRKKVAESREKPNSASMINDLPQGARAVLPAFFIDHEAKPRRCLAAVRAEPSGIATRRLAEKVATVPMRSNPISGRSKTVRCGMGPISSPAVSRS